MNFTPLENYATSGNKSDKEKGQTLISEGKIGCIVLAGGQGSRLKNSCTKALFPVSNIKQKTLLQLFCEKTKAASKKAKHALNLAVMTSPLNENEIAEYLKENQFFGIKEQIFLYSQEMLPLLDLKGNPLPDAQGPDGNGGALQAFYRSGIWEKWRQQGIEYVHVVLIDNPLADPFDANLAGFCASQDLDVAIKSILREKEEEKVGILVNKQGKIGVVEYSEFPEEKKREKNGDGSFTYKLANISLFCFSMPFIQKVKSTQLPLHFCKKQRGEEWILKSERFIFDLLPLADKVGVLVYPRDEVYSPLKNSTGEHSLESVQRALLNLDRKRFYQITGKEPGDRIFELAQEFHYLEEWEGKILPDASYISF